MTMLACKAGALDGHKLCLIREGIVPFCPYSPVLPSNVKSRMCCFSGSSHSEPSSATQEQFQKELALPLAPPSISCSLPGIQTHCSPNQSGQLSALHFQMIQTLDGQVSGVIPELRWSGGGGEAGEMAG